MTAYELSAILISLAALIFAGLSYRRSGKSLDVDVRQVVAAEVALALNLQNAPSISFRTRYDPDPHSGGGTLHVIAHNPGDYAIQVETLEITVKAKQYPKGDISSKLSRIGIAGRGEYSTPIVIKQAFVSQVQSEEFTAELFCNATYRNAQGQPTEAKDRYGYRVSDRTWHQIPT
jgi:hypothetical protein